MTSIILCDTDIGLFTAMLQSIAGKRICISYRDTGHRQKCQANPDPNPNPNPTNPNPSPATTRRHCQWFGWAMHRINV